ncbi:general stress protein [Jeotgalibaca sp. A127]|uniref:general stress protein n=1 Tax=Jeotgalibaca sp. A127 TaxID=3457324 RepID=UPI003FD45CDA
MNRRIEGSFREYGHLLEAIEELKAGGYETNQLLVVTRNDLDAGLTEKTGVDVVVTRGESLWDKIVGFFTVDLDDDEEPEDEEDLFEKYGIDEETYERFEEDLENGEFLLLVDTAPPAKTDKHAEFMVRDGIIKANEEAKDETNDEAKLAARPDWTEYEEVNGDMPRHSITKESEGVNPMKDEIPKDTEITESEHPAEKDEITGEEIVVESEPGDATEGDEDVALDELQHDEIVFPDEDKVSTDPFGGETETKE